MKEIKGKHFVFNYIAFFTAFAIGILYVYISSPKKKIVIKYPNPFNAENTVYQTNDKICYKYKANEVKCDNNSIPQPIL
jgi:hypothetical protein